MKSAITALLFLLSGFFIPLFALTEGDYENRLREAELSGDRRVVETICKEWYASGKYSSGLLNWNYNALMSVEQNAVLFTQQESDTYPAMLLQYALQVRPDISVISFQLLENQQYREILIDREDLFWIPKDCSLSDFVTKILNPQTKSSPQKPVYFGSMTNKNMLENDKTKLYLTGLAFKFSRIAYDNLAALRYNFENRFRTDYLELNFVPESDPAAIARINLNYIPALLLLHRHYAATGETEKAARLQQLAIRIAKTGDRETEVRAFFEPESSSVDFVTAISPKSLEKTMKKVGDKLYAAETETTNGQYETFLQDLLKNKDFERLDQCRTAKTDWVALLPEELQRLPEKVLFEHGHPDGADFPAQQISHKAATEYCAWITKVYNASPEKKKFKKVLFRLPTEAEWITAARGGLKESPYPWGGYFVRNVKGCYLGNYNSTEPCGDCPGQSSAASSSISASLPLHDAGRSDAKPATAQINKPTNQQINSNDGGFFPVKADSYFPNRFGLYNISGNVAEMLSDPTKTKGGSWQDIYYYGQVEPSKPFDKPSPTVGFRVFMEVIEE